MAIPNMAMIPSGYKPTKLYSVLPTPSLGSNVVTNGDFSNGSTDWVLGSGWSVSNGKAIAVSSVSGQSIQQSSVAASLPNGSLAEVSFEVLSITQGSFGIYFSGTLVGSLNSVGVFSVNFTKGTETSFYIRAIGTTSGSIDNISVKEVFALDADFDVSRASSATRVNAQGLIETPEFILSDDLVANGDFSDGSTDWTLTGLTVISNGVASFVDNGTNANSGIEQNALVVGNKYKVTFDVSRYVSGRVQISSINTFNVDISNGVGTYTTYIEAGSGQFLLKRDGIYANYDFDIDNISVVQVERENIPRLDYTDGGCPVLLTEPQSTNLIADSEDFSQWDNTNVTLSSGFTSPSGDDSAYSLTTDANSSSKLNFSLGSLSASTEHSVSVFVKKVGSDNQATLRYYSVEANFHGVAFDFDTKVLSNQIGTTTNRQVQELSNGWFRISYTFTTSSVVTNPGVQLSRDNASKTVLYYGAQIEELSYATSYMPTYGAISTRASETITNSGDVNTFNSTEGVLFADIAALSNATQNNRYITISDGNTTNRVFIYYQDNLIRASVVSGGTNVFTYDYTTTVTDYHKVALKYKENDFALWINGVEVATDTSGAAPISGTLANLSFANYSNGLPFFGKTSQVQVFNTALNDYELELLTGGGILYDSYEEMRLALNYNIQ